MLRRPPTPDRRMERRNSNADQPIDLTNMDVLPTNHHHIRQPQQQHVVMTASTTTDDSDSYVPESLADFVAEANGRLEAMQMDFMNAVVKDESINHNQSAILSPDPTSAYWKSPPPPEYHGMTDSQIKAAVFGRDDDYDDDHHHGYIQEEEDILNNNRFGLPPPPPLPPLYDDGRPVESFSSPQLPPPKLPPPPPDYNTWMMTNPQSATMPQPPQQQPKNTTQQMENTEAKHMETERSTNHQKQLLPQEQQFIQPSVYEPIVVQEPPFLTRPHILPTMESSSYLQQQQQEQEHPIMPSSPGEQQLLLSLTSPLQSSDSDFRTYSNEWKHPSEYPTPQQQQQQQHYDTSREILVTTTLISDQHHGHDRTGTLPSHYHLDIKAQVDDDRHLMTAFSSPTATDAANIEDDDVTDGITELPSSVTTTGLVTDGAAIAYEDQDGDDDKEEEIVAIQQKQKQQHQLPAPLLIPLNSEDEQQIDPHEHDEAMTPSPLSMGSPKAAAETSSNSRNLTTQKTQKPPSPSPLSPASTSERSAKLQALIKAAANQQYEEAVDKREASITVEDSPKVQGKQSGDKKNGNNSKRESLRSKNSGTVTKNTKAAAAATKTTSIARTNKSRSASSERESSRANKQKLQTPERQQSGKNKKQTPSSASSSSPPLLLKAQKNRSSIKLFTAETAHRLSRSKAAADDTTKSSPFTPSPVESSKTRKEKSQQQTDSVDEEKVVNRTFSAESADRLHKAKLQGSKEKVGRHSRSSSTIVKSISTAVDPPTRRSEYIAPSLCESAPTTQPQQASKHESHHFLINTPAATTPSKTMERLLRPTETWARHSQKEKPSPSIFSTKQRKVNTMRSSSIERLLRPTEAWTHAHEKKNKEEDEIRSSIEVIVPSPVKKITMKAVERLCKPTVSSAAMASPASARRIPGLPHTIFMEKKFMPASLALNDSMDDQQGVFSSNISNPPSPIAPSSHLLMPTVTSATKKREKRKTIPPLPHSTKKVHGASSRLLSATAASRARALAVSEPIRTSNPQMRSVRTRPKPRQQGQTASSDTEYLAPLSDECQDQENQPRVADDQRERRVLTIPKSPKLATIARHGKPPTAERKADISLALCNEVFGKALRDDSTSVGSHASRGSLTIPSEPKLATSLRYGSRDRHSMTLIRNPATDVSLAQSTEVMMRELRGSYHPHSISKREGLTIPKGPKFSEIKKRELPKSTAEKEEEEMEYFKMHSFKANPIANRPRTLNNRRATLPAESSLSQQRQIPEENTTNQKIPKSSRRLSRYLQPTASHAAKVKTITPEISTVKRKSITESRRNTGNWDNQGLPVFKARPPPITTYHPDTPPSTSSSKSPTSTTHAKPFTLATSSRPHSRDAVREASRQRIEEMARQREVQASQRRMIEEQAMTRQYAQQKKMEEAQRRQELNLLQPHEIPKHHKTTTTEPFHLTSTSRREIAMLEYQQRLEAKEEERRRQAASFRAKPVPKTTYVPKRISPRSSEEPLTDAFSPELQSKGRAVARKEFDQYAERQRQITEAQFLEMEARRLAEEEAELQELRRLPVKEGGLIPAAEPINAVFWKN